MFKYSINLTWSEEDNCYVATIFELPGLSAFGETPDEAVKEAKIAAKGFLKVYKEDRLPIPKPNTLKSFSGQTRLRLPKSLHAFLSQEAQREGVSLNSYIIHLLSERNANKKIEKELTDLKNMVLLGLLPVNQQDDDRRPKTNSQLVCYHDAMSFDNTMSNL